MILNQHLFPEMAVADISLFICDKSMWYCEYNDGKATVSGDTVINIHRMILASDLFHMSENIVLFIFFCLCVCLSVCLSSHVFHVG